MTIDEFKQLKVGDKVRSRSGGNSQAYDVVEVRDDKVIVRRDLQIEGYGYNEWKLVKEPS